jgi:hypothetical protein
MMYKSSISRGNPTRITLKAAQRAQPVLAKPLNAASASRAIQLVSPPNRPDRRAKDAADQTADQVCNRFE